MISGGVGVTQEDSALNFQKIEPNLKSACPRLKIKSDIKNNQNFDVRCSEWSIAERKIARKRHLF